MNPSSYIPLSADHTTTPEKFSGSETPLAWLAIECEPEEPIQHDGSAYTDRYPFLCKVLGLDPPAGCLE